jgi:hypothetical protein
VQRASITLFSRFLVFSRIRIGCAKESEILFLAYKYDRESRVYKQVYVVNLSSNQSWLILKSIKTSYFLLENFLPNDLACPHGLGLSTAPVLLGASISPPSLLGGVAAGATAGAGAPPIEN